jgi:NAD(P)-dependent dehydrogenase (short-subunit alcohol dehydrogenase family)
VLGRSAFVIGGATGAGEAMVRQLHLAGADVMIVDINSHAGTVLADSLDLPTGARVRFVRADVRRVGDIEAVFSGQRCDMLAVHAGTLIVKPFHETSDEEWSALFDINVLGMVRCVRAALPALLAGGDGRIVCTSSISGLTASAHESAYCVTKGAVLQLVRSLAVEYRDRGLRCNAICPGFIDTPHGRAELASLQAQGLAVDDAAMRALQGRVCRPAEVAAVAVFLLSDGASFINGEFVCVDNGAMART